MCQPSEVWTRTDSVSVSGPILKKFSGCFLSTSSSSLTRVMRPLSFPALGEDELAGVKKVSKPCILKVLAFSIVSRVSWTQIMLGECP